MVYEYAIEPELILAWGRDRNKCKYVEDKFGLGQPRMMSEYPGRKKWRKKFKEAFNLAGNDNERKRIEELFTKLMEIRVKRDWVEYDGNFSWLENAKREHARCPFHAILDVLESSNVPDFPEERMVTVARKADRMAEAVSPMLSNCTEAIFIDPHFGPENKRHRRPFKAFLQELINHRCGPCPAKIEVHTSDKADPAFFKSKCREEMPRLIPRGMTVYFKRWKKKQDDEHERLHNRFILTNIGAVTFPFGLDDGKGSDIVILLERKVYEEIWKQYAGPNPAFDLADAIEIEGAA